MCDKLIEGYYTKDHLLGHHQRPRLKKLTMSILMTWRLKRQSHEERSHHPEKSQLNPHHHHLANKHGRPLMHSPMGESHGIGTPINEAKPRGTYSRSCSTLWFSLHAYSYYLSSSQFIP